jgi:hypothetical protein
MCVDALHMRHLLYIWKWSQIGIEQDFFPSSIESGPKVTMFLSMTHAIQVPSNTTCVTIFFGESMATTWEFCMVVVISYSKLLLVEPIQYQVEGPANHSGISTTNTI